MRRAIWVKLGIAAAVVGAAVAFFPLTCVIGENETERCESLIGVALPAWLAAVIGTLALSALIFAAFVASGPKPPEGAGDDPSGS